VFFDVPLAVRPADGDTIWRYIDFTKFVTMLKDKALYFSRVDLLEDKFEGWLPPGSFDSWFPPGPEITNEFSSTVATALRNANRTDRQNIFVNCWHANEHESEAMWRLYSDEIAIRSTFGRLKASFAGASQLVVAGKVSYIDHDAERFTFMSHLRPSLLKRKNFSHENEVRAIHWLLTDPKAVSAAGSKPSMRGLNIPVDLTTLIDMVYVSPRKKERFHDRVKAKLARYGHKDKETKKSRLAEAPIW